MTETTRSWGFASSTGLDFTEATIVDAHFRACKAVYLEQLHRVGIRPGWRVLDAGCGSGSFLPPLAELVGEHGAISAIDLAEENAALAADRAARARLGCPVEVCTGTVLRLPYPDGTFDALWCANTVQYLDDDQLRVALGEFRRVVRPGGVVAVKELDPSLIAARPGDPFQFTDFFRAAAAAPGYARQLMRSRELHHLLAGAGLVQVRQHTVLAEHFAPFSAAERRFYGESCAAVACQAERLGVPGEWRRFLDQDSPRHPLNHPSGYLSEGSVLAVGTV